MEEVMKDGSRGGRKGGGEGRGEEQRGRGGEQRGRGKKGGEETGKGRSHLQVPVGTGLLLSGSNVFGKRVSACFLSSVSIMGTVGGAWEPIRLSLPGYHPHMIQNTAFVEQQKLVTRNSFGYNLLERRLANNHPS